MPGQGLTVRDRAAGERVLLPDNGATRWKVATGSDGVNRVSYRHRGWRTWRGLDGGGEFFAGGEPITLVTPAGERAYRGWLRVGVTSTGDRVTVNALDLDGYLKGVVPLEIPALWSAEAVQAQAVAARTYASYERRHPRSTAYQLCDTTSCQVYGGYDAEHPASNRAVDATAGEHPDQRRRSRRSPSSARAAAAGPRPGRCPTCAAQAGPVRRLVGQPRARLVGQGRRHRIERAWPAIGDLRRIAVTGRDGNGHWGGRVGRVALKGTGGQVVVSGDTFRVVLGLRSTWVTFAVR